MTKREYKIRQLLNHINEEERKSKNISYQFYKNIGAINEDTLKTDKSYDKMVEEEVDKIKNKFTIIEEIKAEEKVQNKINENEDKSLRSLIIFVFTLYLSAMAFILYNKAKNKKIEKQFKKELGERIREERINSYQYLRGGGGNN